MKKLFTFFVLVFCLSANGQITKLVNCDNYNFGQGPYGSLYNDGIFLYGMTSHGGVYGDGIIFKVKPDGTGYAKLYDFLAGSNGYDPQGSLISDGTYLYGMTTASGTIFKIMPDGTSYTTLYTFTGLTTGDTPFGSLYYDGAYLYGTTSNYGPYGGGTLFKIKPDGTSFTTLVTFGGLGATGLYPKGSLISDGTFLYGMTYAGGASDSGTIFKVKPDGTGYVKLYDFNGANGAYPTADLFYDGTYLYGMTVTGGIHRYGVIFKIKPDGTGYIKLYDFAGGIYGRNPYGSFLSDGTFLYGMTTAGGPNTTGNLFKIKPDGTAYTDLIDFINYNTGMVPYGSLIFDGAYLYGMTEEGGTNDYGEVFKCAIPVTVNSPSICTGNTTTLTASGVSTYTYTWNTGATGPTISVSPTVTTTYTVTGVSPTYSSVATATVFVYNSVPTLSLTSNTYTICSGSSKTFSVSGASTYTWSPPSNLANSSTANPIASPTTSTIYTVTGSNACGTGSSLAVNLIVNTTPTLTVNSPTVCSGITATLTASGAGTYTWNTGATSATYTLVPHVTTHYTVSGGIGSCTASTTSTVSVNATPTITVNSGAICAGNSFNITPSGANTYTYSSGSAVVTPSTTTSYSVTGTSAGGCVSLTAGVSAVTILPLPIPSLLGGGAYYQTVCSGDSIKSINVTPVPWYVYQWTNTNTSIGLNTIIPNSITGYVAPVVSSQTVGYLNLSVLNDSSNCYSSSATNILYTITINPSPSYSLGSNTYNICEGDSQIISVGGVNTYTWSPVSSLNNSTIANPTASPSTTTVYSVTGTSVFGCTNLTPATVTVNVNPTPTVSIVGGFGNAQTVCAGAMVSGITFSVSPAGSVSWTNSNTNVGLAASASGNIASYPAPNVSVQTTAVITASATANGCPSTSSTQAIYTITINALPGETGETISPSGCGSSNGTIIGATGTGGSTYSYQWNNTGGFVSSSSYTNGAGTYPLQIKDNATGCIYSQNFTIPNASAPTITVSTTNACVGSVVSFWVPAATGTTYNWTDVGGNNGTGNTYTVSLPASPSPFTVMVTATNMGCTSAASTATVGVNPLPSAPIFSGTTGSNSAYCEGLPVALTVNSGTAIAVWYSNNNVVNVGSSFTPQANLPAGTYTFSIIDSLASTLPGCVNAPQAANTVTLTLVVNPTPPPPMLTAPTGTHNFYCVGSPATLTVNSGVATAVWYSNNNVVNVGSNFTPNYSVGTYTFSVIDSIAVAGGCIDAAQAANTVTLNLTVNPTPIVTYTLVQDAAPHTWDLYPTISGGMSPYTYSWNWGDGSPSDNTAYPSHTYSVAGSYSICVTVTDGNSCTSTYCENDAVSRLGNNNALSSMVNVNVVNGTIGIKNLAAKNQLNIYPNPAQTNFTIETSEKQNLQLFDVNGKLVLSQTINGKTNIDATILSEGVYNISLISNEGVINKRLVIVR